MSYTLFEPSRLSLSQEALLGSTNPRVPIRRIVRLFRPYRWSLLFVAVLVGASSLVSLVNPVLIREIIRVALPQGRTTLLAVLALGMIVVSIANSSFSVSQTYVSTKVGQRVMHDLRTSVYSHLQRMSLAFFTRTRTGEVQSRIANDIGGMQATVTTTATTLVSNLTTVVATTIAMIVLDWRLTIASLVMMPVFVWVSRRVGTERRRITRDRQRQLAVISSIVQESLSVSGILLGHTMGRSRSLADSFAGESSTLSDLEVRSNMAGRSREAAHPRLLSSPARGDLLGHRLHWVSRDRSRRPPGHLDRHAGRVHHLAAGPVPSARPAPERRRRPAKLPGAVRPHLRVPGPAGGHRRAGASGAGPDGARRGALGRRGLQLRGHGCGRGRGPADPDRHRRDRPGRAQPRDRRRDRLRQDDPELSHPAPVRRDRRPRADRRRRRTGHVLRRAHRRGGHGVPGDLPVPRLGGRQPA